MGKVYFITHPEVVVDPQIPIPQWGLSEEGGRRLEVMLTQDWVEGIKKVFSSLERKAADVAEALSDKTKAPIAYMKSLGEVDRSSTGFLGEGYEEVVKEFFAKPNESAKGWEKAADAQMRIVEAIREAINQIPDGGDAAITSHGAVGALLFAYLKKEPISIKAMQKRMGSYFVFDKDTKEVLEGWKEIDQL